MGQQGDSGAEVRRGEDWGALGLRQNGLLLGGVEAGGAGYERSVSDRR